MLSLLRTAHRHRNALYWEPHTGDVGVCSTLPHQAGVVNEAFFVQLEEVLCSQDWCVWATLITLVYLLKRKHMRAQAIYLEESHGPWTWRRGGSKKAAWLSRIMLSKLHLMDGGVRKAKAYWKLILVNYVMGSQKASWTTSAEKEDWWKWEPAAKWGRKPGDKWH